MPYLRVFRWFAVSLFLSCFPAVSAFAETIELVTYYPAPAATAGDLNVTSLAVGYPGTTPAAGTAIIFGPVGIGTAAPGSVLHVVEPAGGAGALASFVRYSADAIPPSLSLVHGRGTAAMPTRPLANDWLGLLRFQGVNTAAANFDGATIQALATVAWTATSAPAALVFSTTAAATNPPAVTERMRITETGNVGIGTAVPTQRLHVVGSIQIVDGTQANGRVLTSDANGVASWQAVTATATLNTTNCKLGVKASRSATPQCGPGFYMKALVKSTDNNWDGYGSICCALDSSTGTSFNAVVDHCNANKAIYGTHVVTCPAKDPT